MMGPEDAHYRGAPNPSRPYSKNVSVSSVRIWRSEGPLRRSAAAAGAEDVVELPGLMASITWSRSSKPATKAMAMSMSSMLASGGSDEVMS